MISLVLRAGLASVLVLSTASAAAAQSLGKPGSYSVIGPYQERLAAEPTEADLAAVWPAAAKAKNLGGSAVMHCVVAPDGELADCGVMTERSHAGFGAALLSLAPKFRARPFPQGQAPARSDFVVTATWPLASTPADWQVAPKTGDFSTSYTYAAWKSPTPGVAVMNCLEARMGALHDCMVVYQDPPGKGFGTMLLRFQTYLNLKPAMRDGKPIDTGVNIAMRFGVPSQPAP
jgi:hypothetical protein